MASFPCFIFISPLPFSPERARFATLCLNFYIKTFIICPFNTGDNSVQRGEAPLLPRVIHSGFNITTFPSSRNAAAALFILPSVTAAYNGCRIFLHTNIWSPVGACSYGYKMCRYRLDQDQSDEKL